MRVASLPSARVVVVVFLWGSPMGRCNFWIGVPPPLRWRPPPVASPWRTRPRGLAEEWPRPLPVPPPERLRRG